MSVYQIFREWQYQQFYITDGSKELRVFCSRDRDPGRGQCIRDGTFRKHGSSYEIYTECGNVEAL